MHIGINIQINIEYLWTQRYIDICKLHILSYLVSVTCFYILYLDTQQPGRYTQACCHVTFLQRHEQMPFHPIWSTNDRLQKWFHPRIALELKSLLELLQNMSEELFERLWLSLIQLETKDNIGKYDQSSHQIWMKISLWSLPLGNLHWNI